MHNSRTPVQVDELVHPRVANESFLKLFIQPRRSLSSSPSDKNTGLSNQSALAILLRNVGDSDVTFKVMSAFRSHAAESQTGDSAYGEEVAASVLKAGGFKQLLINNPNRNLYSFVMTSAINGVIRVNVSSASDVTVWKSLEREDEKDTHLDTFLQDETPKVFYSTSSPSSEP